MSKISLLFLISISFLATKSASIPLDKFSFLLGNWEYSSKNGKITEHWKKDDNRFIGASYKHDATGKKTLTETVVLEKIKGTWHFVVTGFEENSRGTTNFKLVSTTDNSFTFENLAHDFPQRIVYQPHGKNSLLAWIEGKINGKSLKIDFPYKRIN